MDEFTDPKRLELIAQLAPQLGAHRLKLRRLRAQVSGCLFGAGFLVFGCLGALVLGSGRWPEPMAITSWVGSLIFFGLGAALIFRFRKWGEEGERFSAEEVVACLRSLPDLVEVRTDSRGQSEGAGAYSGDREH